MTIRATCQPLPSRERTWTWDPFIEAGNTNQPELPIVPIVEDPPPDLARQNRVTKVSVRMAHLFIEAVQGLRKTSQLAVCFDPLPLTTLADRLPDLRRSRARLGSIHVQPVGTEAAEVTIRLAATPRDRAVAMRIERHDRRWRCTALLIG